MTIFWLSVALWFLGGIEAFSVLVRRKATSHDCANYANSDRCDVELENGEWKVYKDGRWKPLGQLFAVYAVCGWGSLIYVIFLGRPRWLFNLGFPFVAKDIIPLEISRKLASEEQ